MSTVIKPDIKIHQIYYDDVQLPQLDPAFEPYSNCNNPQPVLREYFVFKQAFDQGLMDDNELTGFFSWKFREKAMIKGEKFLRFVRKNPGYDVYFINPMSHELFFKNVWTQGEHCHPGIVELANKVFKGIGYDVDLAALPMGVKTTLYCNFWVGTPAFWRRYMRVADAIYHFIEHDLSDDDKKMMFTRADRVTDSVYFPFVMERLLSTLLVLHPEIKALSYKYSTPEHIKRYPAPVYVRPILSYNLRYLLRIRFYSWLRRNY